VAKEISLFQTMKCLEKGTKLCKGQLAPKPPRRKTGSNRNLRDFAKELYFVR
jgi:hypothetical protein